MVEFFKEVQDINENIQQISEFIDEIQKLHNNILSAPTPDESKNAQLRIFD
jgi:hypothetical protein